MNEPQRFLSIRIAGNTQNPAINMMKEMNAAKKPTLKKIMRHE